MFILNRFLDFNIKANFDTRNNYDYYSFHRNKCTNLILEQGKNGKILIMGAGNCNDVDLVRLTQTFIEVHLVDLDLPALEYGVSAQLGSSNNLYLHAADVSQVADKLDKLTKEPFTSRAKRIHEIIKTNSFPSIPQLKGIFDIVVSQCMVSQLVYPISNIMTCERKQSNINIFAALARELVVSHLKEMAAYLLYDGIGIVITDTVQNEGDKPLENYSIFEILKEVHFSKSSPKYGHNIFGTNIFRTFDENKKELGTIIDLKVKNALDTPFWIWNMSKSKQYIVQTFAFSKIK